MAVAAPQLDDLPSRSSSLGFLHPFSDKLLLRVFSFLGPRELLQASTVSWMFWAVQEDEILWRTLALEILMDKDRKLGNFCFHGTWRATVLRPNRFPNKNFDEQITPPPPKGSVRDSSRRPIWARMPLRDAQKWYDTRHEDLFRWPMRLEGVDRRHKLSRQDFIELYEKPNRPVILTGIIDDWPALTRWKPHELVKHFGEIPVRNNGRSTDGRRFRMRLFDFLAYCSSVNREKYLYVFDKKIFGTTPELLADYTVPEYFTDDLFSLMDDEDRPDYRWLLIGPHGSGTPLHTDPHRSSAWNSVISGCKRVSLYPPEMIPPGVDEELIDSDYYASDDALDWYRNRFPTLVGGARPIECLVFPGETLFIPSGWWHCVLNIGLTVAITQNLCSHVTFPWVAEDISTKAGKNLRRDFKVALAESPHDAQLAQYIICKRRGR
jgi:hypothetical protein